MSPAKIILAYFLIVLFFSFSNSTDMITPTRPLKDGNVLVSSGESFALGFFSPQNSSNRYVGIWFNKVSEQTVVWVANRDHPITNSSGVLSIDQTGNLVLHERDQRFVFWSSNASTVANVGFMAQLLDSGNLVLFQGENRQVFSWQSFDHPTNTFIPGMKVGWDRKTGLNRFVTSWKSSGNPSTGEYSFRMELVGSSQVFLYKGMTPIWRAGSWTGQGWSGVPQMTRSFMVKNEYINNEDEVVSFDITVNSFVFSRFVMTESGIIERLTWHETDRKWVVYFSAPISRCDLYSNCGSFGLCDPIESNEFECKCLSGYEPTSLPDWLLRDGSKGCTRKARARMCQDGDGFVELARAKVPDTSWARVNMSLGLEACRELCLRNCTCLGYASANISGGGRGCITWYGEMIDARTFSSWGQSLYIRVDAAELATYSSKMLKGSSINKFMVIGIPMIAAGLLICACISCYIKMKRVNRREQKIKFSSNIPTTIQGSFNEKYIGESVDLQVFDISTIVGGTNDFSPSNKLGEGGFGSVYKVKGWKNSRMKSH